MHDTTMRIGFVADQFGKFRRPILDDFFPTTVPRRTLSKGSTPDSIENDVLDIIVVMGLKNVVPDIPHPLFAFFIGIMAYLFVYHSFNRIPWSI